MGFVIWQIIFPLIYIFVAGFAYTALIHQVPFGNKTLDYPAFIATGMIGFNIMNSTLISGIIIWNDRRHGMFDQILVGPFTRAQYILSNVYTIGIIGLVSAGMITAVGYPLFFNKVEFNILTVPLVIFASITGSILFGSIASIISTRLKSSEGFNVVINTAFLFFAFVSTAFYPAQGTPPILSTAFYFNPLTYLVDVVRAGIFGYFNDLVATEMIILGVGATILFLIATKLLSKLEL